MDNNAGTAPMKFENHVFQSIFLDKGNRELWTMDEIEEDKVIERKWWHQLGHRWQHYVRVVPGKLLLLLLCESEMLMDWDRDDVY